MLENKLEFLADQLPSELEYLVNNGIQAFQTDLQRIYSEKYEPLFNYYNGRIRELSTISVNDGMNTADRSEAQTKISYFTRLLSRLEGKPGTTHGLLIDYLSSMGVLPSYSFPLNTVELMLFNLKGRNNSDHDLRLERDLKIAISEYAPGSEIVADKRIWKSQKPLFWHDTPPVLEYRICHNCQHLEIANGPGVPLKAAERDCSVCGNAYTNKDRIRKYVVPDAFLADPSSGKPAKQYVATEQKQIKSALIPETYYTEEQIGKHIAVAFNETGKLLYVNEGKYGSG